MADRILLIDTSIFIDFLRKQRKDKTELWKLREQASCAMSSVTLFELLAGANTEIKRQDATKLSKWIAVLPFDATTAEIAGNIFRDLRARNALIEFRDIFIAATALQHRLELATFNKRHFERVNDLLLV